MNLIIFHHWVRMPLALFFYPKYLTVPRVHTLLVGLNPAGVTLQAAFAGLLFVYMFLCVCAWGSRVITQSVRGTQEAIIPGSLDTKCLISLKKRMSCSSSHILQMDTEDALKTRESVRDAAFQLAAIVFL